ncbi:MAG: type II toxin-antitoxin system RatA family toxin [Alphaproteobacteria bacterium]|nr:type II toxin-antitoxin system RatA family toxin [Alphaproteobacteria bacterium]
MHHHKETRVLPYTVAQMFDMVADIEKYPEFLPWCTGVRIVERKDGELIAGLGIGYGPLTETYTSRVILERPRRIEVVGIKGPFRYLDNLWEFSRAKSRDVEGVKIDFSIDFAFKSFLLQTMMGAVFHRAVHHMVRSFEARARDLFGEQPRRQRRVQTASGAK